jgi:hypothetical protein
MGEAIYILCALTSAACAFLLLRGYLRTKARLLLWSALCFVALFINNVILFLDLVVFTHVDLYLYRSGSALAGLLLLLFGLIWDSE